MPPSERPAPPRSEPRRPPNRAEREARAARIEVNPAGEVTLIEQQPLNLAAVPLDVDGDAVQGLTVEWESSDRRIVYVTKDGQALAGRPGRATLTASVANLRERVQVTVVAASPGERFGGRKGRGKEAGADGRRQEQEAGAGSRGKRRGGAKFVGASWSPDTEEAQKDERRMMNERQAALHSVLSALHSAFPASAAVIVPSDLPDEESPSLYQPRNAVGSPPGKTTPGASMPATATDGTEMPGSSNFSFGVPIAGLPGRGLNTALSLIYNSQIWNESQNYNGQTVLSYDVDGGWPASGFRLGFGQLEDRGNQGFTLTDPDGTRHEMRKLAPNNPYNFESTDGTFIKFYGGRGWGTVTYTDGTRIDYGAAGGGTRSYPTRITERNGNFILIFYVGGVGPMLSSVQDTLGRYVRFHYAANGDLVTVTAPGYANGAARQTVRLYYQDIAIDGAFQSPIVRRGPVAARVIRYVYLPGTRTGYRYDYSPYGMIRQITELRGMQISTTAETETGGVSNEGQIAATTTYNYPATSQNLTTHPTYTQRTDDWAGRTAGMPGTGAAPFNTFAVNQAQGLSTVTAPDGTINETKTIVAAGQWNHGLIDETTIKKPDGTVLAKTKLEWEQGGTNSNPRPKRVWTTNEAGQTRAVVYTYTSYSNIFIVSEHDFAATGQVGTELRRTETTYETRAEWINRGLVRLPGSVKTFAGGSGTPAARVDYVYDTAGTNLTRRDGMIMHDATYNPYAPTQRVCGWEPDPDDPDCPTPDGAGTLPPNDGFCDQIYVCRDVSPYNPATDKRGNVTAVTRYTDAANAGGAITDTIAYDIAGNVVAQTADCCQLKAYGYSSSYNFAYPTSETRGPAGPTQLTTSALYDFNTGLITGLTDENYQQTTINYYPENLRHLSTSSPGGGYTETEYGDSLYADPDATRLHSYARTRTKLRDEGPTAVLVDNWQFFDGRGAVARAFSQYLPQIGNSAVDVEYDALGRVRRTSNPYFTINGSGSPITSDAGLWTTNTYDHLGRTVSVRLTDGNTVSTTYAGTVTTVTDQAGKQRRQLTDALGRTVRVDEPNDAGQLGTLESPAQPTSYDYDTLDNLLHLAQGGQQRYFKYDSLSRLTHERHVEQAAPHYTPDNVLGNNYWSRRVSYNGHSLVTDAWDARNVNTHFEYDSLNRVKEARYSDSTPKVTYAYDQNRTSYPYNTGQLTEVRTIANNGQTQTLAEYDYDAAGRSNRQRQTIGGALYEMLYGYNLAGQLTSERYPTGRTILYDYDAAARLASVRSDMGGTITTHVSQLAYTPHGGLQSEQWGNGAQHTQNYNARLQLDAITLAHSGTILQHFGYGYGEVNQETGAVDPTKNTGQVARIDSHVGGTSVASSPRQWQQRLSYDALGRLNVFSEYLDDGGAQSPVYRGQYGYDRYGNRYQSQAAQPLNYNLTYTPITASDVEQANNRLTTNTTYDAAGNVTNDSKFRFMQYAYDANGRMASAQSSLGSGSSSSVYDGAGQRVQTSANGYARTYVYDLAGQVVAEYGSLGLERELIYRGGQAIATIESSGCVKSIALFIADFYQGALGRQPSAAEQAEWETRLTTAARQSHAQLLTEAQALGNAVFAQYPHGSRTNRDYVRDLYRSYPQREPDAGGWDGWTRALDEQPQTWTRERVRVDGFATGPEFSNLVRRLCASVAAPPTSVRQNVAAAANGATALASSEYINGQFPASATINGDRRGTGWGAGGGWNDGTQNAYPDWLEITFAGPRALTEINVFTVQDNFANPSEPTEAMTCGQYGIIKFEVQYWTGSAWAVVPGGNVGDNTQVWRQFTFAAVMTDKLRVVVGDARAEWSRIVEVEAYAQVATSGRQNVAAASAGASIIPSSSYNGIYGNYPASAAINGDRRGANWGAGGGWNDATPDAYPDTLQINFAGQRTITEIDVFTLQDNYPNPVEPTEGMTFTQYGIRNFEVQYWDGSVWVTALGGAVVNNDRVWRRFDLAAAPVTTDKIRVVVHEGRAQYSRITEIEAYAQTSPGGSSSNGIRYILSDQQGSARLVMDGAGAVVSRHDYQPFGEEVYAGVGRRTGEQRYGASDQLRQRYALTERDEWTGLEHTWFRKYERSAGRWTSPDPYNGSASIGDPQSFNKYAYVNNDPVNFVDPSGLLRVCYYSVVGYLTVNADTRREQTYALVRQDFCVDYPDAGPIREPREPREPRIIDAGQRKPLDPNSRECQELAQKIANIRRDIDEIVNDIEVNPGTLPETAPGPRRNSVQGHRELLDDARNSLQKNIDLYRSKCGGGPPPLIAPSRPPVLNPRGFKYPQPGGGSPRLVPVPALPVAPIFTPLPLQIIRCLVFGRCGPEGVAE